MVMFDVGFRRVWPMISSWAGSCGALFHRSLLLMVFGQHIWRIFLVLIEGLDCVDNARIHPPGVLSIQKY